MTENEVLMWCWITALYQTLNEEQKKVFTDKLVHELNQWRYWRQKNDISKY